MKARGAGILSLSLSFAGPFVPFVPLVPPVPPVSPVPPVPPAAIPGAPNNRIFPGGLHPFRLYF